MEISYHTVNVELTEADRALVEQEFGRIQEFVKNFPQVSYHVEVERSARKGGVGISLHVNLPTRSLFANAWGGDLRTAIELAVDKVQRQAKKHLDRLRKDERAGADTPRNDSFFSEPSVEDLQAARDLEDFKDQISHHSARLHRYLRREIELLKRGGRPTHGVSLPDIVEDALAYVFEHFGEKPKQLNPDRWLIRRGLLILHEELDHAEADTTTAAPAALVETPEDWEELMGLTIPEQTPMEGQAADAARASPELIGDRNRAQAETAAALARLDSRQRHALLLRHLEGYRVPEIAYVLNAEEQQVEQWIADAEVTMQKRLSNWSRL